MIITKVTQMRINKKNINHFTELGYEVNLKDVICIDPTELSKGSNVRIDVSCDRCGLERNIKYQSYIFNIERSLDGKTYTCDRCSHEKIRETNIKKYGTEYYSKTKDFINKIKKTSMERFGLEHFSKTEDYIKNRTKTNMEKYGVENPFQLTDLIKSSMMDKYGVDHPSKIKDLIPNRELKRRKTKEKNGNWVKIDDLKDWNIYKNRVRTLTSRNKKELFENWDGKDYYDGEYIETYSNLNHNDPKYPTIDHRISIYHGFVNKIEPELISDISNLVITKRILNIKKSNKDI